MLRRRYLVPGALLLLLVSFGSYQYKQFILAPSGSAGREIRLEELVAERWYQTATGRELTESLARVTDSGAMKLASGLYYREYKRRYSPGVKLTQYVRVGPNQYPAIHGMIHDACKALGGPDGPVPAPTVYVGWTGKRSFEVTNHESPSLIIGNDFLWAFKPEELRYLIARQIGHIQCRHVYLLDVTKGARALFDSVLPDNVSQLLLGGLGGKLLEWQKEAQISADRAGLLVTRDVDTACAALIKLNILASIDDFYGQPDPEEFAAQAAELGIDRVATASAALAELKNPNPFLTARVADLLAFHAANEALFKDRRRSGEPEVPFDPGDYGDEDPGSVAGGPAGVPGVVTGR
ncbi:MAG: hypothetical protein IH621_01960 [Krumholzibacteria bacterium]|nr:hypothetical protein [Candidatus Krumholzibacteria bacterium]